MSQRFKMDANETANHQHEAEYKAWRKNFEKQYNGNPRLASGTWFRRPELKPAELEARVEELRQSHMESAYQKQRYRNACGYKNHEKYTDLDAYYSSTKQFPRRLVVQATADARDDKRPRHWGHRDLKGRIPLVVRLSEFCLNPFGFDEYDGGYTDEEIDEDEEKMKSKGEKNTGRRIWTAVVLHPLHWITSITLTLLLSWIIQICVSVNVISTPWTDSNSSEPYSDYENVHWTWPKHAVNILDQSPRNRNPQSNITRLTIPRLLVVKDKGQWVAKETSKLRYDTGMLPPYIFFSFSRSNYPANDGTGKPADNKTLRPFFHSIAQSILDHENKGRGPEEQIEAFWVDTDCVSKPSSADYAKDVNTICDAVRCSKRVYIVLPSDTPEDKLNWGKRIWTLPEVLLGAEKIRYCVVPSWRMDNPKPSKFPAVSLTDMYKSFWLPHRTDPHASTGEGHGQREEDAICHLIDHYTNRTILSDLQRFTFAVQALAQLTTGSDDVEGYTTPLMAYAAMGLMSYRLNPDESDNAFQAIARLSLVNDTNRLLERLICLSPRAVIPPTNTGDETKQAFGSNIKILRNIADRDQYWTHLWDINPICDVVGIADEDTPTVILDRCRGIPIRWKSFPRLKYTKGLNGLRANLRILVMHIGSLFFVAGINLFPTVAALGFSIVSRKTIDFSSINVAQSLFAVLPFLVVGWIISWYSPTAVRKLCDGGQKDVSCHLVGFEGVMSLKEIEKTMYYNYHGRLSYAASTTPFSENLRHKHLRTGKEPKDPNFWTNELARLQIPRTHRLFTIVDTGNLTVSVVAAERPPVVALICGREGGMLRALLCSWRFENNCLYRESVMRMRSSLEGHSTPNDWLKVSLASQGDANRMRMP